MNTAAPVPCRALRWLALLLLTMPLVACFDEPARPKPKTPSDHLVEVATLAREHVSTTYERTGSLRLRRLVRIYNQEEGRVLALPWYEGDSVAKGEALIRLEDDLIQAELQKAQAKTRQARLDLKRLQGLANRKAASQDELARARTNVDIAVAEERVLSTRLGYTRISAPYDGIVTERHAEPGDVLSRHTHVLTLADPESMVVEIPVSELLLPLVAPGDSAQITIDALGSETHAGTIRRIHPELDPLTRQGTVEVAFDRVPAEARAGQFARVRFTSARRERLMIPFGALRHDRDGEHVFVVNAHRAKRLPVRSGLRIKDRIELLAGADVGQQVVVRGFLGLSDDKPVAIVGDSGPD